MQIGELKHRIEVLERIDSRDEYGGIVSEWLPVGRIWAKIEPKLGDEKFEGERVQEKTKLLITIRFYPNISTLQRVKYNGEIYNILSVINKDEARRWSVIECEKLLGKTEEN